MRIDIEESSDRQMLIAEWSAASENSLTGDRIRMWVRDADGLRSITAEEYERYESPNAMLRQFSSFDFHVCDDGTHVVWSQVWGPMSACGGRCAVDPKDPRLASTWLS